MINPPNVRSKSNLVMEKRKQWKQIRQYFLLTSTTAHSLEFVFKLHTIYLEMFKFSPIYLKFAPLTQDGFLRLEAYPRVHILSSFGYAHSRTQPVAWPMTLSAAGGRVWFSRVEIRPVR